MKKLKLLILLSFGMVMSSNAGQFDPDKYVILPEKNLLIKRLNENGLNHFVGQTPLINIFESDKILPINASLIIDIYLDVYEKEFGHAPVRGKVLAEKVYKCVFGDYPQVLNHFGYNVVIKKK